VHTTVGGLHARLRPPGVFSGPRKYFPCMIVYMWVFTLVHSMFLSPKDSAWGRSRDGGGGGGRAP
jgi:hypothetical protein